MQNHDKFSVSAFIIFSIFSICVFFQNTHGQSGFHLTPISGADGVFEIVVSGQDTIYRSAGMTGSYALYMYFKTDQYIPPQTVYLEVTYKDIGYGSIQVQYNSSNHDYSAASTRFQNYSMNSGRERVAVFELSDAHFRDAQNLNADLRLSVAPSYQMYIVAAYVYLEPTPLYLENDEDWVSPYNGPVYRGDNIVDASTLSGKVICGYQGWFRAAGDPSGQDWVHYVNGDFNDLTVEMWPDMLEYSDDEKYPVPGWTHANGDQAYLFSSANKKTVIRHFQWMEAYGIDGVAVQRFVSGLNGSHLRESFRIPGYAREAANRTGRTYFIMYDMSGHEDVEAIRDDWQYLVDVMKITDDDRYLHHDGKPVVAVFGFFADRFAAALGNQVLDIFQNGGPYEAFFVGSGQWPWRSETASGWPALFRRMDAWIPWNVGNYSGSHAATGYWTDDKDELAVYGALYMPLIYPGFGWDNLMNQPPETTTKPRLQGDFMWQQFLDAKAINAAAVYVAMFDEIDEGTAIFKVANDVPVNHYFLKLEGLPSDYYLLLTGFGTNIIKRQVAVPGSMPDFAVKSQPPVPAILSPTYSDTINEVSISWTPVEHLSGITGYELELDNQIVPLLSTDYSVELQAGEHAARVRAINGLSNKGGFSETVIFNVQNSPKAVRFASPGDYVEVPHAAALAPSEFTIEFWLRVHALGDPNLAGGEQTIIDKRGANNTGYNLRLAGTEFPIPVFAFVAVNGVSTGPVILPHTWYHVAVTQDNDSLKIYFAGKLVGAKANVYLADTKAPLRIGEFLGYPGIYLGLRGDIDELRIWNRARNQSEIQATMHQKLSGSESGLAAYWDFDSQINGKIPDLTINGNNGVLYGNASLIGSDAPVGFVPPAAPVGLRAYGNERSIDLVWKSGGSDISAYQVYRAEEPYFQDDITNLLVTIDAPESTYTDNHIIFDRNYYYRLRAVDGQQHQSQSGRMAMSRTLSVQNGYFTGVYYYPWYGPAIGLDVL